MISESTLRAAPYVLIKGLSILGVRAGESARRGAPELAQDYVEELPRLASLGVMRPHRA
jgi:NADPH:quinone reductase